MGIDFAGIYFVAVVLVLYAAIFEADRSRKGEDTIYDIFKKCKIRNWR